MTTYLEREQEHARKAKRPVYRFSLDRYECPFCGEAFGRYTNTVYSHMKTCPKRKDQDNAMEA